MMVLLTVLNIKMKKCVKGSAHLLLVLLFPPRHALYGAGFQTVCAPPFTSNATQAAVYYSQKCAVEMKTVQKL